MITQKRLIKTVLPPGYKETAWANKHSEMLKTGWKKI